METVIETVKKQKIKFTNIIGISVLTHILKKYLLSFSHSDFSHVTNIVVFLLRFFARRQKNKFHVVTKIRKRSVGEFH